MTGIQKAIAGVLIMGLFSGCQRLANVGQAPEFSPMGASSDPIPAALSLEQFALSSARPTAVKHGNTRASLWGSGPISLYSDRRARNLGDILTVVIEIDDKAQISNESTRSRSGSENLSVPDSVGIPQLIEPELPVGASLDPAVSLTSDSASAGAGAVARREKITLRIAGTVVRVLPNGNLLVQGNQEVRVNYELRDLQISGIVRPEDISRRNEITYDKIAGARISYGGRGQISDMQQPRYGQQISDIVLPF